MKNIFRYILIFVFAFILFTFGVHAIIIEAPEQGGDGNSGSGQTASKGETGYNGGGKGAFLKISIYDSQNKIKGSKYFYLNYTNIYDSPWKNSSTFDGYLCSTDNNSYQVFNNLNPGSITNCENLQNKPINYDKISLNISPIWDGSPQWIARGSQLDNYFRGNNFTKLLETIDKIELKEDLKETDFIVIEPAQVVECGGKGKYYLGTATALIQANVSYKGDPAKILIDKVTNQLIIGIESEDVTNKCVSSDSWYGNPINGYTYGGSFSGLFKTMAYAVSQKNNKPGSPTEYDPINNYDGYGYFRYNVSDFFEGSLIINKQDINTKSPLNGATFELYSGLSCSGTAIKTETTGKSGITGQAKFDDLSLGEYSYKEISAPDGYILNSTCYNITIEKAEAYSETVYNDEETITNNIYIAKIDQNKKYIAGAKLQLLRYNTDKYQPIDCWLFQGNNMIINNKTCSWTSSDKGPVEIKKILPGEYIIREISTPYGYTYKKEDTKFVIGEDNSIIGFDGDGEILGDTIQIKNYAPAKFGINFFEYKEGQSSKLTKNPILSSDSEYKIVKGHDCSKNSVFTFDNKGRSAYLDNVIELTEETVFSLCMTSPPKNGYKLKAIRFGISTKTIDIGNNKTIKLNEFTLIPGDSRGLAIYLSLGCATELNNLTDKSPQNLISLYYKYGLNGLLDFNNPKCEVVTCQTKPNVGCLTASIPSNFNYTNLSCYDSVIYTPTGDITAFCKNTFELTNNIGINTFYGVSGQALIEQKDKNIFFYNNNYVKNSKQNNYFINATLGRVCYSLFDNINSIYQKPPLLNISFGFDNNTLEDVSTDELSISNSEPTFNGLYKYEINNTYHYNFRKVYFEELNGKITNFQTPYVKYGLFTKLNQQKSGTIPFSVKYGDIDPIISNDCKFNLNQGLIDTSNSINLEFRIIDTKTPFPNRNVNSNWCVVSGTNKCSSNNNVVREIIINRPNSYGYDQNGKKSKPIYKIILGPSDIQTIRNYNKSHPYDEILTIKDKQGNDINKFISDLKNGTIDGKTINKLMTA